MKINSTTIIRVTRDSLKEMMDMASIYFGGYTSLNHYIEERMKYKLSKDSRYDLDKNNMRKRIATDACSEVLLYKFSKGKFQPDFTIGQSNKYNHADFKDVGLNLGLKTVQGYHAHLVKIKPEYPELLTRIVKNDDYVDYEILGVATVDVMNKYSSIDLVKSPQAKKYKRGFNKYDKLISIFTFDDLWQFHYTQSTNHSSAATVGTL